MEPSQGRRLHAAMELAGIASTDALARRIGRPGMSKGTLDRMASDKRQIKDYEADWIAQATGVPASFFLDETPVPAATSAGGQLADRLKAIEDALVEGRKERVEQAANIERLLKRQDGILQNIEDAIERQARATTDAEDARAALLKAAEVASQAYEDAAQRLAEAHDTPAK